MRTKNYHFLLLILFYGIAFNSYGQLIVNVGKDTTYCTDPGTISIPMGLNVEIKNGIEPYKLAWECTVVPFGYQKPHTASTILNDSTMISPTIKEPVWSYTEEKVKFILNITDQIGNRAKDSLFVSFSGCGCPLGYQVIELNKGDSIWLDAGIPQGRIATYSWLPVARLSNPDSSVTWCKPNVNTDLFLVSTDTSGCTCVCHVYEIRIIPTYSNTKLNPEKKVNPFQQGSKVYFNNPLNQEALVSMFSLDGKLVYQCRTCADYIELSPILPERGQHIVKIAIEGNLGVCKFLKQ